MDPRRRSAELIRIPPLDPDERHVSGRSVTAVGRDMIVFGGVRWENGGMRGELLDEAWMWLPPCALEALRCRRQ